MPPAAAVTSFLKLRDRMIVDKSDSGKRVSTSELIDWFTVLRRAPEPDVLKQLQDALPFASTLLESWDDYRRYVPNAEPKAQP